MTPPDFPRITWAVLALLAVLLFHATGCGAPGYSDNTSARPWNEPRGFDLGVPGRDNRRSVYRR